MSDRTVVECEKIEVSDVTRRKECCEHVPQWRLFPRKPAETQNYGAKTDTATTTVAEYWTCCNEFISSSCKLIAVQVLTDYSGNYAGLYTNIWID